MSDEKDLENLLFCAVEDNGVHWIYILNDKKELEDQYNTLGKIKNFKVSKDSVIATDKYGASYCWEIKDLNHSPKCQNLNKGLLVKRKKPLHPRIKYLRLRDPRCTAEVFVPNVEEVGNLKELLVEHTAYAVCEIQVPRSAMKILPLGTGNANPKNKYGNSCFLLEADKKYLVDFPRIIAPDLEGRLKDVRDIFITHVHNDHLGSLVDFLLMRGPKENGEERINIYSIKEVSTNLIKILDLLGLKTRWNWSPKKYQSVSAKDFANFIILDDTLDATHHIGSSKDAYVNENGLRVVTRYNMHGDTPCAALKFIYKDKKIGISGDCNINEWYLYHKHEEFNAASESTFFCKDVIFETGPNAKKGWSEYLDKSRKEYINACIGWFDDCDLIFHEVTNVKLAGGVHTHISDLEKDLSHLKDKLFLYHVDDNNLPKSDIFQVARRGMVYRV
jgi:hypothetical protein